MIYTLDISTTRYVVLYRSLVFFFFHQGLRNILQIAMNRIRQHNLSSPNRRNSCDGFHHIHKFLRDNLWSLVVPLEHNIANLKEVQFRMMNHIHSMGTYLESNNFSCGLMLKAIAIDLHSSSRSTSHSSRYYTKYQQQVSMMIANLRDGVSATCFYILLLGR